MRINGVKEHYCTGDATDPEKFEAWAETVPYTIMNPLYHWTHLELLRYFEIQTILNLTSSQKIYNQCTEHLKTPECSCRGLLHQMNVHVVCTTNDPVEDLSAHIALAKENIGIVVVPGFRADRASQIMDPIFWRKYISELGESADSSIESPQDLLEALQKRHDFFAENGCMVSDHGEEQLYAEEYSSHDIQRIFDATILGNIPTFQEIAIFKSWLLYELAKMDHAAGWTQQFHLSAMRNNNSRARGPDTGYDSIGDFSIAQGVSRFMDRLHQDDHLARTILYSVNPTHNEVLASMCGNFCEHPVRGKFSLELLGGLWIRLMEWKGKSLLLQIWA